MKSLKSVIGNKVLLYLISRYLTYGIQFVGFLTLSAKMGPYHYGRWGFFLMIISYFSIINFGIQNSTDILLVQNKDDKTKEKNYVASAMIACCILAVLVLVVATLYFFKPIAIFEKYNIDNQFYLICIIAIIHYFTLVFGKIYRIKNRLFELAFNQTLLPVTIIICACFFEGERLFNVLVVGYRGVTVFAFLIYVFRGAIPFGGKPNKVFLFEIIKKGFFLFLYNSCFYLILTTTSTVVSNFYTVSEYGYYTFSYSLGHSVLMLLDALTSIVFPKIISRFYTGTIDEVKSTIKALRTNYVSFSHGLMYVAFAFFPLLIKLFPKYESALPALCITGLAVMLNTNSFGFNTYLIAKNDEKVISGISVVSLISNICIGFVVAYLHFPFYCVVLSIICSYLLFAYLCAKRAMKKIFNESSTKQTILAVFPGSLFVPFITGVLIVAFKLYVLSFLPLIVFVILNISTVKEICLTTKTLINKPNIIDLK